MIQHSYSVLPQCLPTTPWQHTHPNSTPSPSVITVLHTNSVHSMAQLLFFSSTLTTHSPFLSEPAPERRPKTWLPRAPEPTEASLLSHGISVRWMETHQQDKETFLRFLKPSNSNIREKPLPKRWWNGWQGDYPAFTRSKETNIPTSGSCTVCFIWLEH